MPMKRGAKTNNDPNVCHYGTCGKRASKHHHFTIDLRDGKPLITIHACGEEHKNELQRMMKDFLAD